VTYNVETIPELPVATTAARPSSLGRDTIANILRQRSAVAGLVILGALVLIALFADVVATHHPEVSMLDTPEAGLVRRGEAPCIHALGCAADKPQHLMGLDSNLRDEFSRVVHGSRISLQVGFVTVGLAIIIGLILGSVSGFAGGWLDNVIMRLLDVVLAFPTFILAIAIVTVLGSGLIQAQLAIAIVSIPVYARVMRASVLSAREADFVTASRALGESSFGILTRRILPNSLTPLIVAGTLGIGGAIVEVAALSFLGLGAQQPQAEWGSMIGFDYNLFFSAPHLIFFPGFAITLTVLGFNLLGDGLRDALDPRLNR
ncbi:MAG: ABC transporter permease, partial [Candidatus Limnocylindrales bacterium]